jgi:predicted esterase
MRRRGALAGWAALALAARAAKGEMSSTVPTGPARRGILQARPHQPVPAPAEVQPGTRHVPVEGSRDALLLVPAGYRPDQPAPLVVAFHGAGGDGQQMIDILGGLAEERGFLLLSPASRRQTWDVILGGYGPDVGAIERTLVELFRSYAVDPARIATAGFSDGASYALSLGISNGDLFTDLLAFSPGFMAPSRIEGQPRIFISHGVKDTVLPINPTSRQLIPRLRAGGNELIYREFPDGHVVPPEIAREAVDGFLRS